MSNKGHVPIRMCIACGKRRRKEEMIRFTKTPDRMVVLKEKKDQKGRGLYLCPDPNCLKKAERKKGVGFPGEVVLLKGACSRNL
jgi:uncharacterized protein